MNRLTYREADGRARLTDYGKAVYCSTQATADILADYEERLEGTSGEPKNPCYDAVFAGMEALYSTYGGHGVFNISNKEYTTRQLINELRSGSDVGNEFRKEICEMVLTYLMKFRG